MVQWVSHDAIVAARRAPLYDYLLARHPTDVIQEGDSLRLVCNHSVSIRIGYAGFQDFATGETGNAIECLVNYLGYDFMLAVSALCAFIGIPADFRPDTIDLQKLQATDARPEQTKALSQTTRGWSQEPPEALPGTFVPPAPVQGPYRQLFAYLVQQRGIPAGLIQRLVDDGLLYQEAGHNNIVFVNPEQAYAEVRGTIPNVPFHGMAPGSDPEGFWFFTPIGTANAVTAAFICEGAIDAISLHLLRQRLSLPSWDNPMYCSIGGVANQRRIDRIKAAMAAIGRQTVLAVDNDDAGELCRQRNTDCYILVPQRKDWNADWLAAAKDQRLGA